MTSASTQRGFTLLEMMTAIAVVGIVLGLAVPALNRFVEASNLSGSARGFVVDLQLARSEAALRAQRVTVCTSTEMASCETGSWDDGRLVFVDAGTVGSVDAGDVILSQTEPLNDAVTTASTGIATANFISYAQNGMLTGPGTISLCVTGQDQRIVNIFRSGSASLDRTATVC
jgi:type IV fimbrial biogenesis protein FimT